MKVCYFRLPVLLLCLLATGCATSHFVRVELRSENGIVDRRSAITNEVIKMTLKIVSDLASANGFKEGTATHTNILKQYTRGMDRKGIWNLWTRGYIMSVWISPEADYIYAAANEDRETRRSRFIKRIYKELLRRLTEAFGKERVEEGRFSYLDPT